MTAEIMQTQDLKNLLQHDLTAQLYLKSLLINTSRATKKVDWPNREWLMYKCHEPYKSCKLVNPISHWSLFSRRWFQYTFTQDFAARLPSVAIRFSWQTLQTSLQLCSFVGGLCSLFSSSKDLQIISFSRANTRTGWRLQTLPLNKWRDSDRTILTARHSAVQWVLHISLGVEWRKQ